MNSSGIVYRSRADVTPEAELDALAAVYKFLIDSQARRGGPHDLIKDSTKECTTSQDKKGMQNADLHGD
jgi:hypothetical protein